MVWRMVVLTLPSLLGLLVLVHVAVAAPGRRNGVPTVEAIHRVLRRGEGGQQERFCRERSSRVKGTGLEEKQKE